MKIYAIFANDNMNGTTRKLFNHAIDTLRQDGHEIDILNLYEREEDIPFFKHDRAYMESQPFYLENKERFLNAQALLLVFPLYWYSVPGILKTWLDMINAWAYKYEHGLHAKPLHSIQKALIVYSSMQDKKHLKNELHHPVEQQLSETCKFIGIPEVLVHLVDNVTNMTMNDFQDHLCAITNLCKTCTN